MSEQVAVGTSTETIVVSEAYAAARELLRQAEEDAARIRADADRYMRQREQEAELLVSKARRLLALAGEKAASLSTLPAPVVIDLDAPDPAQAWDLDPDAAPVLDDLEDEPIRPGSLRTRNELDSILANAVSNAINRALPSDR